ncbi:Serine/threonine protein kinase-related domain protein [Candidatus Magnetomorum sp. HK-1]|nr:Serine/threonine protein kinase-related domain protein [Candidatus Magnetomorum sp. HK-1]
MKKFSFEANKKIDNYQIKSEIGMGGIGEVYSAYKLNKKGKNIEQNLYAIKILKPQLKSNKKAIELFKNDIKTIKKLRHNNIISIVDIGEDYFVMPYIEGKDIKEWLSKNEPFTSLKKKDYPEYIKNIFAQINSLCDALIYAHGENISHNDLKPSNIIVTSENQTKIIDFGLSNLKSKEYIKLTEDINYRPDTVQKDNPFYIDVYSLAIITFELISGNLPKYHQHHKNKAAIQEKETILYEKVYELYEKVKKGDVKSVNEFRNAFKLVINNTFESQEKKDKSLVKKEKSKNVIKLKSDEGEQYMFTIVENNTPIPYYFTLKTDTKVPDKKKTIKLGDGTYGAVFQVHTDDGESCAVKLLYKNKLSSNTTFQWELTQCIIDEFIEKFKIKDECLINSLIIEILDPHNNLSSFANRIKCLNNKDQQEFLIEKMKMQFQSVALKRFKEEAKSKIDLLEELGDDINRVPGVITIKGGTEIFQSSNAYQNLELRENFKKLDMELSDYAVVMPLFSWTLKDILEKGTNSYENEPSGYHVLSKMIFADRIATMMPFLIDVATGIKSLHSAKLFHHDIKPANIFVNISDKVESVVGDLGFLKAKEKGNFDSFSTTQPRDSFALGTIHYRAPEQKEYFDISDARISHDKDNVEILIYDPKFRASMIEDGDFLFFSRDDKQTPYIIKSIDKTKHPIRICLDCGDHKPAEDNQTQIVMYKLQGIRTDLYGIGAIVFDMLTCGKSPERFYETIRSYDNEDGDIKQLLELYRQVSTYQADERGIGHIFESFEDHNEYAPLPIVELILKCMMSRVKNTYHYNPSNQNLPMNYAIDNVLARLIELSEIYGKYEYNNMLINKADWDEDNFSLIKTANGNIEGDFLSQINKLQNLNRKNEIAKRLVQGIWYIDRLENLVRKTLNINSNVFISEMLPDNMKITSEKTEFDYIPYKTKDEYLKDLIEDGFYTKIIQNFTNPFVPDSFSFLRKKIALEPLSEKNTFKYNFLGSSPSADDISPGDIIINDSTLWCVADGINYEDHVISIEVMKDMNKSSENKTFNIDKNESYYIFYKRINPCKYYLKMLGCYLYHIFFVGIGENTIDKPLITNFATIPIHLDHDREDKNIIDPYSVINHKALANDDTIDLKKIYEYITYMYLKLTFCENKNSYYQLKDKDNDRIYAVSDDVLKLKGFISNFLQMTSQTRLIDFIKDFDKEETQKIDVIMNQYDTIDDIINFKEMFLSLMKISTPKSKKQIQEEKADVEKRKLNQQNFEDRIQQLDQKIKEKEAEIKILTQKAEEEKEKCESENNTLKTEITKLETEKKKLEEEKNSLNIEKNSKINKIEELNQRKFKNRVKNLWERIKKKKNK